jgi:hypothetical protein
VEIVSSKCRMPIFVDRPLSICDSRQHSWIKQLILNKRNSSKRRQADEDIEHPVAAEAEGAVAVNVAEGVVEATLVEAGVVVVTAVVEVAMAREAAEPRVEERGVAGDSANILDHSELGHYAETTLLRQAKSLFCFRDERNDFRGGEALAFCRLSVTLSRQLLWWVT